MPSAMSTVFLYTILAVLCIICYSGVTVRAQCQSPPPPINNTVHNVTDDPPYSNGTVVRYTCSDGYRLEMSTLQTTCLGTEWSVIGNIGCTEIFCGHIETPDGGLVTNSPTYEVGTFMDFSCLDGYDLAGTSRLFCRIDGDWNPPSAPTCTIRDCGEFGDVLNGETFQDNSNVERNKFGSVVEVTCNPGYVLDGASEVRCQSNGEWELKPSCLQTSCEPYPGLTDRRCVLDDNYSNNLLFIVCQNTADISGTKVGPSYARCENNVWDNTDMACLCDCKLPDSSSSVQMSNLNEHGFLPHGQTLEWTCLGGAVKVVTSGLSVVCENGELKGRTPNAADTIIASHNQTVKDSDLCVPEDNDTDEEDDKSTDYTKNIDKKTDNSASEICGHTLTFLVSAIAYSLFCR